MILAVAAIAAPSISRQELRAAASRIKPEAPPPALHSPVGLNRFIECNDRRATDAPI